MPSHQVCRLFRTEVNCQYVQRQGRNSERARHAGEMGQQELQEGQRGQITLLATLSGLTLQQYRLGTGGLWNNSAASRR